MYAELLTPLPSLWVSCPESSWKNIGSAKLCTKINQIVGRAMPFFVFNVCTYLCSPASCFLHLIHFKQEKLRKILKDPGKSNRPNRIYFPKESTADVIGKNNAEDFRAFAPDSWTRYGAYKKVVEQSRARFIKYTWLSKDKDLIKKGNWR